MDVVSLWKHKRPAGWCWWQAYRLESDSLGTWVFTPARSSFVRNDGAGPLGRYEHWEDPAGQGRPSLVLFPRDRWFVGHWVHGADRLLSVDITTPPRRSGSDWTFDDLELDPFVLRDGSYGVDDEDEFAEAVEAGLITRDEQSAAERTVETLRAELSQDSPHLTAGLRRLSQAVDLGLEPLRAAPEWSHRDSES